MCRMILAVGEFSVPDVLLSIKQMASAVTADNEYVDQGKSFCHFDGWGVAYMQDGRFVTQKSTKKITEDEEFVLDSLNTSVLAAHTRAATVGDESIENTHPFVDQKTGLILFHNGTIQLPPEPVLLKPKGHTDSERLFLCIAERVLKGASVTDAINAELSKLTEFSGVNLIVLSQQYAYVTVLHKITPRYYTMFLGVTNNATIISSEKVPIEGVSWTPIENKRLIQLNLSDATFAVHEFPHWAP